MNFFRIFYKTFFSPRRLEQFWKQNTFFREKTANNCIVNNLDEIFTMMALNVVWQMVASKRFNYHEDGMKKLLHNQQGTIHILRKRHPLSTFGSFSFFQAALWLGVDKVLQKLTKSYRSELWHLFQFCILIPRKCPCKNQFQALAQASLAQAGLAKYYRRLLVLLVG